MAERFSGEIDRLRTTTRFAEAREHLVLENTMQSCWRRFKTPKQKPVPEKVPEYPVTVVSLGEFRGEKLFDLLAESEEERRELFCGNLQFLYLYLLQKSREDAADGGIRGMSGLEITRCRVAACVEAGKPWVIVRGTVARKVLEEIAGLGLRVEKRRLEKSRMDEYAITAM